MHMTNKTVRRLFTNRPLA